MRSLAFVVLLGSTLAAFANPCKTVNERVAEGLIPQKYADAVQSLIDSGPGKWITVEDAKTRGKVFQRGVGGTPDTGFKNPANRSPFKSGGEDSFGVLIGEPNAGELHTSVMPGIKQSAEYLEEVNREFANPLAIRGDAKKLKLSTVTEPDLTSAGIIKPGTLTPDTIHSLGFFYGEVPSDTESYTWTSNYLHMMTKLKAAGVVPAPGSRGEAFLQELESVWSQREWNYTYKESHGPNEMRNFKTICVGIRNVFNKYRSDSKK